MAFQVNFLSFLLSVFDILTANCDCDDSTNIAQIAVTKMAIILGQAALNMFKDGKSILKTYSCDAAGISNTTREEFESYLGAAIKATSKYFLTKDKHEISLISPPVKLDVAIKNKTNSMKIGK